MSDSFPSLGDIVGVAPRLVDRTRSQLVLLRSLAALVPCVGRIVAPPEKDVPEAPVAAENVSVLSVISDPAAPSDESSVVAASGTAAKPAPADKPAPARKAAPSKRAPARRAAPKAATTDEGAASANGASPTAAEVPSESDLPIQDYDGLAASQVVPRLATMTPDELEAVARYEAAHRSRRTILNRVAQLLKG